MKRFCLFLSILITTVFAQDYTIYNLKLDSPLSKSLSKVMIDKIKSIDTEKTKAIIFELNSSSGRVDAAYNICREFDFLAESGVPVYAYVKQAEGAAALLAVACEKIYMHPDAKLGNIIIKTTFGSWDQKAINLAKDSLKKYAENQQYSSNLIQSMVDPKMEVREISYRAQRLFKTTEELNTMRSDPSMPNKNIHDKGVVVKRDILASFNAEQCKNYEICREIYSSKDEMLEKLELNQYEHQKMSNVGSDSLTQFLTHRWVRIAFLTLGLLALLVEMFSPGLGIPAIAGLAFFIVFFVGGQYAGLLESWELVLFVIGLGFIGAEFFLLPGLIIMGVLGIFFCFCGVLLSMQSFVLPSTDAETSIFMGNVTAITFSLGANIAIFFTLSRLFPKKPMGPLSLEKSEIAKEYKESVSKYKELEGKKGTATTTLRPSGKIQIEEQFYDVVSQGEIIEVGKKVEVVFVEGNRIVVEIAEEK